MERERRAGRVRQNKAYCSPYLVENVLKIKTVFFFALGAVFVDFPPLRRLFVMHDLNYFCLASMPWSSAGTSAQNYVWVYSYFGRCFRISRSLGLNLLHTAVSRGQLKTAFSPEMLFLLTWPDIAYRGNVMMLTRTGL